MQLPFEFFLAHARYRYDPRTETAEQGRRRCAKALADAELKSTLSGWSCKWEVDTDSSSADWPDGGEPPYAVWGCTLRDEQGKSLGSLWSIDFGREGEPWGQPYRRVIEAELALEALP